VRRAIVLGGGVAGIAAAFLLRDRGFAVALLEAHRWLGGRAFSLPARGFRDAPDNGPHVMLGCYEHMRRLLRRLGTEDAFAVARTMRLLLRDPHGRESRLVLPPLPTPLAMPLALCRLRGLAARERVAALRGMAAALRAPPGAQTLAQWIACHRQDGGPRRYLWEPLCRAILNAEPDVVAADLFVATLRRAFAGRAANAAIWLPKKPWSAIIDGPAQARLAAEGIELRTGARVASLDTDSGRIAGVTLDGGERIPVGSDDLVVSALPWHAIARLVPELAVAERIAASPLVSIWFEFDRDLTLPPDPLVALVDGTPFHFMVRRPGAAPNAFALLAGGSHVAPDVAAVEALARAQIARHFPECALPGAGRVRVAKEARATILAAPGIERPAPGRVCGLANLRACGDWTATGLPSTLEGAAMSAHAALADLPR
jgi:zeta-carotene desaturase